MTLDDLIQHTTRNPFVVLGVFLFLPLAAFLLSLSHPANDLQNRKIRILYAVLVYASTIPGIFSSILILYSLFFIHQNLLKVDLLVYFLPLFSMVGTLLIIRRKATFSDIPGFKRLSGLILMLSLTFLVLLIIHKTFIGIFFRGSLLWFLVFGLVIFALIKYAAYMIARKRKP